MVISFIVGNIFCLGLCFSGMTQRTKISGFLTLDENWDPSLLFVLFSAVLGNMITFNIMIFRGKSLIGDV